MSISDRDERSLDEFDVRGMVDVQQGRGPVNVLQLSRQVCAVTD